MRDFKTLVYLISVGLALLPSRTFAHGGVDEPQSGLPMSTYGLLAMGLLFILFVAFYMVVKKKVQGLKSVKKKENRIKRQRLEKNLQVLKWGWILSLVGVVITGSLSVMGNKLPAGEGIYL
ncbi:hypothetical protein JJL05_14365 [Staphylococcus aureus]|uniref:hypothetical protein n=1 Tax=Staphylococcus aureus TaxID=1280 RepID=UPI00190D68B0|nr:hypothetical protein [Staphylococcus aureus]MBK4072919.1 hypothetical protein [Staphylococcus aureus]